MILANEFILFPIIGPLLTAMYALFIGASRLSKYVLGLALALTGSSVLSILILQVLNTGNISYVIGGYSPYMGIELSLQPMNCFFLLMIYIGLIPLSLILLKKDDVFIEAKFYAFVWFLAAGVSGMLLANDLFNIYVFLEISALSSYLLAGLSSRREAHFSAISYLFNGTFAATLYLLGIGIIFFKTGSLNITELEKISLNFKPDAITNISFILILSGIFIKGAVFPWHSWLIMTYRSSRAVAVILFSLISGNAALYLLAKFTYFVFGNYMFRNLYAQYWFTIIAIGSALFGGYMSGKTRDLREALSYSSIANYGYAVFLLSSPSKSSMYAAFLQILSHTAAKSLCFYSLEAFEKIRSSPNLKLSDLQGIGRTHKLLGICMLIGLFSLTGIPLTIGFVSKFNLLNISIDTPIAFGAFTLSAYFSMCLMLKCVEKMYLRGSSTKPNIEKIFGIGGVHAACCTLLAFVVLVCGTYPKPLIHSLRVIAEEQNVRHIKNIVLIKDR